MDSRLLAYSTAAGVFALDRLTKWLIETHVSLRDTHVIIPGFFNIIHSRNPGAAFSLFANANATWRTVLLVGFASVALVIMGGMLWNASRLDRFTRWGLPLIFGGAVGNVFDRIVQGTVTDFLDFHAGEYYWPAFNVADSAIVVGSLLLIFDLVRPKRVPGRSGAPNNVS
jgi:signal peptidase II